MEGFPRNSSEITQIVGGQDVEGVCKWKDQTLQRLELFSFPSTRPHLIRKRAEYCFESTVSEERTPWVPHQTRWDRFGTQMMGWEELIELLPHVLSETVFSPFPVQITWRAGVSPRENGTICPFGVLSLFYVILVQVETINVMNPLVFLFPLSCRHFGCYWVLKPKITICPFWTPNGPFCSPETLRFKVLMRKML